MITVRDANQSDAPTIANLARQLGLFERKSPEQLRLTADVLRRDAFGESPYFAVKLAEYESQAVGYALFFFTYASFAGRPVLYIEDLFVNPDARRLGAATALLRSLAELALAKDCCRMEWHVFDWNEGAIRFYEAIGAKSSGDLIQFRLPEERVKALSQGD